MGNGHKHATVAIPLFPYASCDRLAFIAKLANVASLSRHIGFVNSMHERYDYPCDFQIQPLPNLPQVLQLDASHPSKGRLVRFGPR